MVIGDITESQAVIVGAIALIILVIIVAGIVKGVGKGWKWILWLLLLGIIAYLLISAEILPI